LEEIIAVILLHDRLLWIPDSKLLRLQDGSGELMIPSVLSKKAILMDICKKA
jgi:hypothetical protein